jgi:hypothetical protein
VTDPSARDALPAAPQTVRRHNAAPGCSRFELVAGAHDLDLIVTMDDAVGMIANCLTFSATVPVGAVW